MTLRSLQSQSNDQPTENTHFQYRLMARTAVKMKAELSDVVVFVGVIAGRKQTPLSHYREKAAQRLNEKKKSI